MRLKELGQQPVSVIVTGYTDVKDLVFCINEGLLYRYVLKPWSPEDVRSAVEQGVRNTRQTQALQRLVPRQVLARVFPGDLDGALGTLDALIRAYPSDRALQGVRALWSAREHAG